MKRKHTRRIARGSALALAIILLGVLTVVGVAAVSLSTQERANAAAYGRLDAVQACANAAIAKLWREIGVHGTGLASSEATISSIKLPDGTTLTAPAHYDTPPTATVKSMTSITPGARSAPKDEEDRTNTMRTFEGGGGATTFSVHCMDRSGRELELELGVKFAY